MQPIQAKIHRELVGKLKSITLSLSHTGKFYAAILMDDGAELPSLPHTINQLTGIDLGLSAYAIECNGKKTANPRFVKRAEQNLRLKQRQLARKVKGSTKTCHTCGYKNKAMDLSVRHWNCPSCGTQGIDRDLNAVLNICDKGILELKAAGQSFLLMEAA